MCSNLLSLIQTGLECCFTIIIFKLGLLVFMLHLSVNFCPVTELDLTLKLLKSGQCSSCMTLLSEDCWKVMCFGNCISMDAVMTCNG